MKKWWIAGAAVVSIFVGALLIVLLHDVAPATARLGDKEFAMRVARTESEREQGLSGTESISSDEALVFVFPTSERWGIWMKDMKYPIDIVWLDEEKMIRHIEQNVQPGSYPDKTFQPSTAAKYVIELKAGAASSHRITIGSQAEFDSTEGSFE